MNIRDIAKICGVSTATVSKVLHNEGAISSETREKVLSVVKEYNYVPYSAVLKGTGPRMNIISVMLSDTGFEKELLYQIEREAFKNSYSVILCNISSKKEQQKYYHILENKGINGLITLCPAERNQDSIPSVSILGEEQSEESDMNAVIRYDIARMGYLAVKYLFDAKHKNIACFLKSGEKEIKAGYIDAYEEIFTKPKSEWIFQWDREKLDEMISVCIADEITAVICSDIEICSLVCDRFRFHGIRVPEQISMICIGNRGMAEYLSPQITSVELPISRMAEYAVGTLVSMMERQEPGHRFNMAVEPEVVERGSVLPFAGQKSGKIVVIGSMNADYYFISNDMIKRDSTIRIKNTMFFPGGEGANQAVGIGKLGGYASMIGCLGNDKDGKMILNGLTDAGVETEGVLITNSAATGKAYIVLDADGKEEVILQEGANNSLSGEYIRKCSNIFENAQFCLLSMEIPSEAILETAALCCEKGIKLIVKGPSTERISEEILSKIDYLIANEEEAGRIMPGDMPVEERADALIKKGIKNVIITTAYNKSYLKNEQYSRLFETEQFPAVDALGVTDAFISALTVELSKNQDIVQAMELATYAAGVSITRVGVQQSMIDQEGLERYKEHLSQ